MLRELVSIVRSRTSTEGGRWLDEALAACVPGRPLSTLLRSYTGASRGVGRTPLTGADGTEATLSDTRGVRLTHWTVDDAARAALLLATAEADADRFQELALGCYEQGDAREQQSWLRALPLLPQPERFAMTAIDACRTNIVPLFESIACENPFPARCFPDRNFNQLVLKALFNNIAVDRIVDLPSRLNPELSRMADDYVSEREAAGRTVPSDIWVVLAPHADEPALTRVRRYLEHEDPAHRRWAAAGLAERDRIST